MSYDFKNATFSISTNNTLNLTSLGLKHGTDKSIFGYLNIYEKYFEQFRDKNINILEIGVLQSKSMYVWREYFPKARVIGVDILDVGINIRGEHVSNHFFNTDANCKFYKCDQSNKSQLVEMCEDIIKSTGNKIDIVIDDGSHFQHDMLLSLGVIFPYLKENGIYIVEDLCTVYNLLRGDHWWGEKYENDHVIGDCVELTLLQFKYTNKITSRYLDTEMENYLNNHVKKIDHFQSQIPPITLRCTSSLAILTHK